MTPRELFLWMAFVLLSVMCVVLLTVNLWGLHFQDQPLDYQRFGTWTQVIASAATFVGVMVALVSFLWQYGRAQTENERKLTEEHTAVFLWLTSQLLQDEKTHKVVGRYWDLEIHNLTKAPIYRWRVEFPGTAVALSHSTKRPLLPNQNVFNLPDFDNSDPQQIAVPVIYFQSRDGQAWRRTATGLISQVQVELLETPSS